MLYIALAQEQSPAASTGEAGR